MLGTYLIVLSGDIRDRNGNVAACHAIDWLTVQ
jgi:hypothetical protein